MVEEEMHHIRVMIENDTEALDRWTKRANSEAEGLGSSDTLESKAADLKAEVETMQIEENKNDEMRTGSIPTDDLRQ